jgi:DNA polymerase-3 subunit beta
MPSVSRVRRMKLIVSHDDLRRALSFVQSAVAKRPTIAILAHVRLTIEDGRLALATTDLNTTALTSIEAEVLATSEGATVNMDALSDVAKAASAPLTLTAANDRLVITTGTSEFKLPTLPVDDYPTLPDISSVDSVEFSASDLLGMLRTCDYPMTEEEARFNLAGIAFAFEKKRLDLVATDGLRMALARLPGRYRHERVVMAHEALVRATKKMTVTADATTATLIWNDRHVGLTLGHDTLLHISADVNFPSYKNFLLINPGAVVRVATAALLSTLRAASPFGAGTARVVAVSLTRGSLTLTSSNIERGTYRDAIAVDYSGDAVLSGYPSRFLVDALEVIATQYVDLSFYKHNTDAWMLTMVPVESDRSFEAIHTAMPIRL